MSSFPARVEKHHRGFERETGVIRMTRPVSHDGVEESGGYGFITPDPTANSSSPELFFFHTALRNPTDFKPGLRVSFCRQKTKMKGKSDRAADIEALSSEGMPK